MYGCFFFKQKTAYEMRISDWSSDVCSSDLGGRIGYVLFYQPTHFLDHPLDIFYVWQGGMSFHGGLIGVILAMILFGRQRGIPFFVLADIVACATPIGLLLGRVPTFINGALSGRAREVPWPLVSPCPQRGGHTT